MSVAAIRFSEILMRAEADLEPCACHEHPAPSLSLATYSGKGAALCWQENSPAQHSTDHRNARVGTVCQEPGVIANLLSTRQHSLACSPRDAWYVNYGMILTSLTVIAAGALYMFAARPYLEKK
jgi:hypothetical protein